MLRSLAAPTSTARIIAARAQTARLFTIMAEGTKITWKRADGADVPGLVFGESGKAGVVCVQEWWGVVPTLTAHARKIADMGYRVVVPDLYRGKAGYDAEEAKHNMNALDFKAATEDVAGAAQWLKAEGSKKVGTIGFCMGGALSLASGCLRPDAIDASVGFYGVPPPQLCDLKTMAVPTQGHFGREDPLKGFADVGAAEGLQAALAAAPAGAKEGSVFIYDKVGHAFLNDDEEGIARRQKLGQGGHDPEAVALAWSRVGAFFGKWLQA